MTTLSPSEYKALTAKPKANKYRAKAVTVDGIRFHSRREAAYYGELKMREKAGEVSNVELQPRYVFAHNGILIGSYRADFRFFDSIANRIRIVDVKGFATKDFARQRKLMRAFYGITVEIIK